MQSGRCSGQCCSMLLLGGDPNYLRRRRRRARWRIVDEGGGSLDDKRLKDWDQIIEMVIYLGEVANPNRPGSPVDHWYTCRNHDADSGNCTIYETRPQMCRDFPNGRECPNAGCTYVAGAA